MDEKSHQHVWAYRGLEYEIGERIEGLGSWRERTYFDVHFCSTCLREKVVPRYVSGNSTAGPPIEGSTPRGSDLRNKGRRADADRAAEGTGRLAGPRLCILGDEAEG